MVKKWEKWHKSTESKVPAPLVVSSLLKEINHEP